MIYGLHRAKGAPALGALLGEDGPFGRRPVLGEDADTKARADDTDTTSLPDPAAPDVKVRG
ncbi:hypothetical protein [Streptomyces glomeratus]|uniref:Uncharacterized protein n=1 Tax=Streptomyces glomeratus TaxID=284452 RepID=A0ABP6LNE1_9ACTN|nr:hypothetical protein [Streptomyces glomeratus]MCF1512694.1 hypothetical protein [Streptomyces glomeratus]